jgi:hypothetical protein
MVTSRNEFKTVVLSRRLKLHAVVETMSEQLPDVRTAFSEIELLLPKRLEPLLCDGWQLVSHSHNIYNGILIVSVLFTRSGNPDPPTELRDPPDPTDS